MNTRILSLVVVAAGAWAAPLGAQQFVNLPVGSWVNDVTPDGAIVVGTWDFADGFIWRWETEPAPTVILGGDVVGVSDDGSVLAGNALDASVGVRVASIWTESGGWQSLGWLPTAPCDSSYSSAYDISGDGTTIVGLSWNGCSGRGFRWTAATGMQELQNLVNGNCRASAISADGSVSGGFAQGAFSRTPAYWDASTAGMVLDPTFQGEVYGMDSDGSRSVGTMYFGAADGTYDAFVRDAGTGVVTNLGSLNNGWAGGASDISEDGNVIVGYDVFGLSREAWVWTSSDGIISLDDRIAAAGVTGADAQYVCRAVSDDGRVVVGGGIEASGGPFGFGGFIFAFGDSPWTNLGGGTAGIAGLPKLNGTGSLAGGSTVTLALSDAPNSTPILLWIAPSSSPLNIFGGTLHAFPFSDQVLLGTTSHGAFSGSTTWPTGLPTGTEAWFQFLLGDPSVIFGITLSNGLKATTP